MELPIQVMVVLFVAIAVGGVIIAFSHDTINEARERLFNPSDKDKEQENYIELDSITASSINNLAEECMKTNYGQALHKKLCYAVHSNTPISDAEKNAISTSYVNNIAGTPNSVFIYFDINGNNVTITN